MRNRTLLTVWSFSRGVTGRRACLSLSLLLFTCLCQAGATDSAFTYQGELNHLGARANGAFDFRFEVFDLATGGGPVAGPVLLDDVAVVDGVFTVELGFGSAPFDGDQLWLGIGVREGAGGGTYTALAPRQKITAAPYALQALNDSDAQDLELSGNTLSLSNDATSVDLSVYLDDTDTDDQTFAEVLAQGNDAAGLSLENIAGIEVFGGNLTQLPGNPELQGALSLGSGASPISLAVAGRYAYVVDYIKDDLKVIDVSDPSAPTLTGILGIGAFPRSVAVSGRYAYVVDSGSGDLKVIDVSDPSVPSLAGSLSLSAPLSVAVSGRYAYVVDSGSDELLVIDVSDPGAPGITGALGIGANPRSVFVSGRYAYVVDIDSMDLKVIDVSNPDTPNLSGSLGIGASPRSVFVSAHYAYVVDQDSDDLKVIDVSDPGAPSLAGSLALGATPESVFVSGRYAFVVDSASDDLKVIDVSDPTIPILAGSFPQYSGDMLSVYVSGRYAFVGHRSVGLIVFDVSGAEATSLIAHSLEAGNLQVRNDIVAQGQLQVSSGINVGPGGIFSDGDVGISGDVTIVGDLNVTGSCTGCASDVSLKHNIRPIGNALDRIGQLRGVGFDWRDDVREASYYPGPQIGVVAQEVEAVFPELVGTDSRGNKFVHYQKLVAPLIEAVKELETEKDEEIRQLKAANDAMERRLATLESRLD